MNYSEENSTESAGSMASSSIPQETAFDYITEGLILSVISTVGLFGNILAFYVMVQPKTSKSFSNNLRGLAVFDAGFLMFALLALGWPRIWDGYRNTGFLLTCHWLFGLLHTFRVGSACMTVCINLERLYAIVYPLRSIRWKRYLLPTSTLIAVVYNLPKYFEIISVFDPETNSTIVETTALRRHPLYSNLYVFWSKLILFELIPYTTILICNILIIVKIRSSIKFRSKFSTSRGATARGARTANDAERTSDTATRGSPGATAAGSNGHLRKTDSLNEDSACPPPSQPSSSSTSSGLTRKQKEEHQIGVILVTLSSVFILSQCLKIVPDVYEQLWCKKGGDCHFEGFSNVILRLSHVMVCLNSTVNFGVYYMSAEKFRSAWKKTFCCCEPSVSDREVNMRATTTYVRTTRRRSNKDLADDAIPV